MCVGGRQWLVGMLRAWEEHLVGEVPSSKCLCSCSVAWREEQSVERLVSRDWLRMRFRVEWEGKFKPGEDT